MTLSKEQLKSPNKIQFIYDVRLKKFMFSNHTHTHTRGGGGEPKKKKNEQQGCKIIKI
jgi:hypothetical protein